MTIVQPPMTSLPDVTGVDVSGNPASLVDQIRPGRHLLAWWHPQALSPVSCKTCSQNTGISEPIQLLSEIFASGCDVVGLSYESPERLRRYLNDIGLEYPVLSVGEEAARAHGVAKVEGEEWQSIPHRVAFLVNDQGVIINRYRVSEAVSFLRVVRDDVKSGPPTSKWEPAKRSWLSRLFR